MPAVRLVERLQQLAFYLLVMSLGGVLGSGCYKEEPASGSLDFSAVPDRVAILEIQEGLAFNFGLKPVLSSTPLTLTVINTGPYPASSIQGVAPTDPNTSFTFLGGVFPGTGGTCIETLAPGATCTIVIAYEPKSNGSKTGFIKMTYINGVMVFPLEIACMGTTGAELELDGGPIHDFGFLAKNGTSERTLTIRNTGIVTASAIQSSVDYPLGTPFSFKDGVYPGTGGTCGATLESDASCTVVLVFHPTACGNFSERFALRFNNGAVLRDTNFTLKGNTEGELSISNGPAYDFGIRAKNTTTQKTFTLTNSGGSEVTNIRELAGNALLAPFTFHAGAFPGLGGTCSNTLAASANCTFIVDFNPSAAGVFNDVITLDYDNGLAAAQSTRAVQGTSQAGWNPGAVTALEGRAFHSAVWTGSEMIVWGGQNAANAFGNGARYHPTLNSWTALSNAAAPTARSRHTAVWAGNLPTPVMIVFGGVDETGTALNSGAMYDPNSNTWTALPLLGAPEARYGHAAIWDDVRRKMIIWGGANAGAVIAAGLGYVFDPATGANGSWSLINDGLGQTPSARYGHSAVWTGAKMLIWGGCGAKNAGTSCQIGAETDTGGIFDPQTSSWITTSLASSPSARFQHAAVWTGTEMLIWGGAIDPTGLEAGIVTTNSGGYYAPPVGMAGDSWTSTSIAAPPPPDARRLPLAFWNGTGAIFWGGMTDSGTGSILQNGNVWSAMTTVGAPTRSFGTAGVFTGSTDRRMIVFGGSDGAAIYSNVIAIYSPE